MAFDGVRDEVWVRNEAHEIVDDRAGNIDCLSPRGAWHRAASNSGRCAKRVVSPHPNPPITLISNIPLHAKGMAMARRGVGATFDDPT